MTKIRESVEIKAPAARVWAVVQEDVKNAPKWSSNLDRVESLDPGPPSKTSRYRYHLNLPGGFKSTLEVQTATYDKPKRCAGRFTDGPLKGTWSYTYTEKDGMTKVVYEMDYQLTGMLRLMGGALAGKYAEGIRLNMAELKRYVEAGKGPKAR